MHSFFVKWLPVDLAIASALAQAFVAVLMYRRKLRSEFPMFFTYNIYGVFMVAVCLAVYAYSCCSPQYEYIYMATNTLLIGLEFMLMYEVIVNTLKPYSALIDLVKMLFRWAAVCLIVSALLTAAATGGPQGQKLFAAINIAEKSVRLLQCGLLLLFFFFERRLGLSWKTRSISIAIGLGVSAASGLIVAYLRGITDHPALGILDNASYLGIVVFWAYCFTLKQPERKTVLDSPSKLIFQRWNEALMASPFSGTPNMAMATADPFLPGVEKTVDRILSRKMVS